MLAFIVIAALLVPTAVVPVVPVPPPTPDPPIFISEIAKANLSAELFNRPVKPVANLTSLFSGDDYPLEALRNEEEGKVAVVLRVGAAGQVTDCVVSSSSGSPSLDLQTCRIFWRRAHFKPARDHKGQAVESAVMQRIAWRFPEPEPLPINPWSMRITIEFVKDGGVLSCQVDAKNMPASQNDCGFFLQLSDANLARLRADAGGERQKVMFETLFSRDTKIVEPIASAGTRIYARQVSRLTIDESGKPLRCEVIKTEGEPSPVDGCDDLLEGRYDKPEVKVGAIEAIVQRVVYISK